MNSSRIKNPCAFRWLVLVVGGLVLAGWMLWRAQVPDAEPPVIAFILSGIAVAILFDNCGD